MMQQLQELLNQMRYAEIPSNLPEFIISYKLEHHSVIVFLLIEDRNGYFFTKDQYEHVKEKAYQLFHDKGIEHVHMLSLILTEKPEEGRRILQGDPFCWLIDTQERRLVIYEEQTADFYGMKSVLEKFLETYEDGMFADDEEEERPSLSGRLRQCTSGWKKKSYVNFVIVSANILLFLICTFTGNLLYNIGALNGSAVIEEGQYYRLFTSMFLHWDINHLFSNMLMLYLAGSLVEKYTGHIRYAVLYLTAGLGGSILSLYAQIASRDITTAAGASGAIFGIVGALFFLVLSHKGKLEDITLGRILFLIFYSLYSGFRATNIDNAAHIGGIVTGFFIMAILQFLFFSGKKKDREESRG